MFALGDYDTTETVINPFNTFSSDDPSASVTITNLAAADVEIHKDGSDTQRASDNGVTVSINFDGVTGNHIISIDLSDNSDDGYYSAGSRYQVRMEGTTVDGATINAWIGTFSIGCTLRPTTAGRKLDVASTGEAGLDFDNIKDASGAHTLTNITVPTVTTNTDMVGTDDAATATNLATHDGKLDTAQADLDTITGTGGVLIGTDAMDRSGTLDVNTKTITDGIIVANTLGGDCITAAKIADAAFVADNFAASSLNDKGNWNTVTPDAVGTAPTSAEIKTAIEAGGSSLAQILADTGELQTDDIPGTLATIAGYLDTEIAAIKTVTDNLPESGALTTIGTDTARLTAVRAAVLTDWIDAGRLDAILDGIKVVTDALTAAAAAKLALSAAGIVSGAAEAGTLSTTQMTTDLSEATDDHYIGAVVVWTSGVLAGQRSDITDYAGANGLLTYTETTEAPSAADTFVIL